MFSLRPYHDYVLKQCSHHGLVAVDEGTNTLFWGTVVHSMSKFFTTIKFHNGFFIWNYHQGIVVHSGSIRAFKFKNLI